MPQFDYLALELNGSKVNGTLSALSEQQAVQLLSSRKLYPVSIDVAEAETTRRKRFSRGIPARHIATLFSQLADLLRSGVPLLRSLQLVQRQTSLPALKHVLKDVQTQVADGTSLSEAIGPHRDVFSQLTVSMIRAGEEGGFLEDSLKRIALFTEQQEDLKGRVLGAMAYPLFLVVIGTLIVAAMLTMFVPKFAPIFDRLAADGRLPWATTTLMGLSDLISQFGWLILIAFCVTSLLLIQFSRTGRGRFVFDRLRLSVLGIGPIVRSLAIARFCRILGTLLRNGVPIIESLQIAKDATGSPVLRETIHAAVEIVSAGKSLAEPLAASGEFPEDVVEMIAVGEEANNIEQVLIDIAETMERRTWRRLELLIRFLEPVMLLIMAGLILFVVIGLLLPVFQSSQAVM